MISSCFVNTTLDSAIFTRETTIPRLFTTRIQYRSFKNVLETFLTFLSVSCAKGIPNFVAFMNLLTTFYEENTIFVDSLTLFGDFLQRECNFRRFYNCIDDFPSLSCLYFYVSNIHVSTVSEVPVTQL
jgi:hypothetical protein